MNLPFIFLLAALFIFFLPGTALGEECKIVHATDMHYISPSLTDYGEYFRNVVMTGDGKVMYYTTELMEAFVEQVLASPPDVLILSGDLTFNGASQSHRDLAELLKPLREAGIPVLVLPGNHDVYSHQAASFSGDSFAHVESPTTEGFIHIWHDYGYDDAVSRDETSASYTAQVGNTLFLLVDTNTRTAPCAVLPETLAWVRSQLSAAKAAGTPVIAVSHQNILAHNSLFVNGFRINNADRLLALYEEYGVICNFSGHMHMQHIETSPGGLTEFATSALSVLLCQYAEATLTQDTLQYHTVRTDVSGYAKKHGLVDSNLENFTGYSLSFFASTMLRQASSLSKLPNGSKILSWLANMNIGYFSGNTATLKINEEYMSNLQKFLPFWYTYVNSMRDSIGKDFNTCTISLRRD